jgi:predicted aspartyl protease
MGIFRTDVSIEHLSRSGARRTVGEVMVDTGSELSWFPAPVLESLGIERRFRRQFRQASGAIIERDVGDARLFVAESYAPDFVVFGEPRDLTLLGARSLEGLNLVVDPVNKRLVDAGPTPAALVIG